MKYSLAFLFLVLATPVFAHETGDPAFPYAHNIPVAVEHNIVSITDDGQFRYIASNGIPNHVTGQFPNRGNPNTISAQEHKYRVPLNPQKTGQATPKEMVVGVAVNGIPFEPATAECYGYARGQRPRPGQSCEWREEAIVNGEGQLGLDSSNAHVQPNGTYHYHGVPNGLLPVLGDEDLVQVGYAADGFPLMVSRSHAYKSSYRLKSGTRPSGPGGAYDGKYTADYVYAAAKVGDLDECNGANVVVDGRPQYMYFITKEFPFAPRCLMGTADESFERRGPPPAGGFRNGPGRRPPPRHGGPY